MTTVTYDVRFETGRCGKLQLKEGKLAAAPAPGGRTPRLARLMALAIKLDDLVRRGEIRDYAEIARLGHVTRPRVTQIMALLNLAPDLQEEILRLPRVERGRDPVGERDVRPITSIADWRSQRAAWRSLLSRRT